MSKRRKPVPKEWYAYGWCHKCEHPLTLKESQYDPEVCYRCRKGANALPQRGFENTDLFDQRKSG